jgi:hypothetical protein
MKYAPGGARRTGIRSDGMCAAVPWWPILFVAARENDHYFWDELVLVVAAPANYTRYL